MVIKYVRSILHQVTHRLACNKLYFDSQKICLGTGYLLKNVQTVKFLEPNNFSSYCLFNSHKIIRNQHQQSHPSQIKVDKTQDRNSILLLISQILKLKDARATPIVIENKLHSLLFFYNNFKKEEKEEFLKIIATDYSVNHEAVGSLSKQLTEHSSGNGTLLKTEEKLRELLTPQYEWLFSHLSRIQGGVRFLVGLRYDILVLLKKLDTRSPHHLAVQHLNSSLKNLLSLFFSNEFLHLQRITWSSPAALLQKISDYEAVHPVRSWADLKQRVGPYRRCFIFTHQSLCDEPLVVLHVGLTSEISDSMKNIIFKKGDEEVVNSNELEDPLNIKAFIFYSISATQMGLQGIDLGNYIIKQAAKELNSQYPHVKMFSTLSPIPTFRQWLIEKIKTAEKGDDDVFPTEEWKEVLNLIKPEKKADAWAKLRSMLLDNSWIHLEDFIKALQAPLMASCSRYLYLEKRRGYALDSVANFHLRNGAVMWRLNWLADNSVHTLTQSCGIMVNYRYYFDAVDTNSLKYIQEGSINACDQVLRLSKGST